VFNEKGQVQHSIRFTSDKVTFGKKEMKLKKSNSNSNASIQQDFFLQLQQDDQRNFNEYLIGMDQNPDYWKEFANICLQNWSPSSK